MKKITLIILSFLVLLLACNKEEKFPTKKDLKGHWVEYDGRAWLGNECVFTNKSVESISRTGNSCTSDYRLNSISKTIYFTNGCKYEKLYEIWIDKKSGLLYLDNRNPVQDCQDIQHAIYKKTK